MCPVYEIWDLGPLKTTKSTLSPLFLYLSIGDYKLCFHVLANF